MNPNEKIVWQLDGVAVRQWKYISVVVLSSSTEYVSHFLAEKFLILAPEGRITVAPERERFKKPQRGVL